MDEGPHPGNPIPLPRTLGSSNFYRAIPRGILPGAAYLICWADIFVLWLGMIFIRKACFILLFIRCSSNIHFFIFFEACHAYSPTSQSHPLLPSRLRPPSMPGAVCCSALFPARAMCGSRGTSAGFVEMCIRDRRQAPPKSHSHRQGLNICQYG